MGQKRFSDSDLLRLVQIADEGMTRRRAALERLEAEKEARTNARHALEDAMEARQVVQIVAKGVQESAHERIAGLVSRCLAAVFDNPYEFKILFSQKRGKTEATLVFERDGMQVNPLDSAGGGAVDVAAFALRLSCVMLSRPALRRTIIMDEPLKFLSAQYRPRVRSLLKSLSKELGVQFIFTTHLTELEIGEVVRLGEE